MEILHPASQLAPPNMCVICEETPHLHEQRVLDTGYTYILPLSDVIGRKYVCEKCALTIANRFGFVSNVQAKKAFHAAEAAAERLRIVKEKVLSAAEDIQSFATDISLGTERAAVSKWVEGDYIEDEAEAAPSPKKPVGRPRKAVASGDSAAG